MSATNETPKTVPPWTPTTDAEIVRWFRGKTEAELAALEQGNRRLYPGTIRRKNPATGEIDEVKILIRVPTNAEKVEARALALEWIAKLGRHKGGPLTLEGAQALMGASYFDDLDTVCFLSFALRDVEPPHGQYMIAEFLDDMHPRASLWDVFDQLNFVMQAEDPRVGDADEETLLATIEAIAEVGNPSPLLAIAGSERDSLVVTMAKRLARSRTPRS